MGWYYEDDYSYRKPREPKRRPDGFLIQGPIVAQSRRGDIGTEWWGRQWVEAITHVMQDPRLDRGKRYARNGSVQDIEIAHGQAFAHVMGSHNRLYHTYVRLKTFTDDEWQQSVATLSEQAIYAAKLLAGEMPSDIEAIFERTGTSLFPRNPQDIQFECSCPDWGEPCKHGAAIYYLLAEQLDADPFVLFHLRGRSREWVLDQLRSIGSGDLTTGNVVDGSEQATVVPSLVDSLDHFWEGSAENLIRSLPLREKAPFAFRQLGNPPGGVQQELEQLYQAIAEEAMKWLGLQ